MQESRNRRDPIAWLLLAAFILATILMVSLAYMITSWEKQPYIGVDNLYGKVAVIDHLDEENDLVYFSLPFFYDDFFYVMKGIYDLDVGDVCGLLMYDNGTPYIFDDVVLDVTYSGWTF